MEQEGMGMSGTMLIIVDVQNDFCEGGALAVAGGRRVAAALAQYVRDRGEVYDRILVTQDWHRPGSDNGGHFAVPPQEPDYEESWPVHCVAGTPGAALHPQIRDLVEELGERIEIVHKGYGEPAYSALEGTIVGRGIAATGGSEGADGTAGSDGTTGADGAAGSDGTGAPGQRVDELIENGGFERVDITGLAYDFCVRATALGCASSGAQVRVLRGLTASVHPEHDGTLERELHAAGVETIRA